MALRIKAKKENGLPLQEHIKKLEEMLKEASAFGMDVLYSNNPDSDITLGVPSQVDILREIFMMPDHLRKTLMIVYEIGKVTAEDVSSKTMKKRSVESKYLNELSEGNYVKKRKDGRTVYFWLNTEVYSALSALF